MRRDAVIVAAALTLALPAAAQVADGVVFFVNPGKTVACRTSSFSGFQELKCGARQVRAEDGGPCTARLHETGKGEQVLFDSNPIERIGSTAVRFETTPFICTLTKTAVRCTNPQQHGFLLTCKAGSVYQGATTTGLAAGGAADPASVRRHGATSLRSWSIFAWPMPEIASRSSTERKKPCSER